MTSGNDQTAIIQSIKKIQENIAVGIGVVFTLTMCVYFFTYSMLVNKGLSGALWMMVISSMVMLLILFRLKPVSLFFTKLWLGRRANYKDAFSLLSKTDN